MGRIRRSLLRVFLLTLGFLILFLLLNLFFCPSPLTDAPAGPERNAGKAGIFPPDSGRDSPGGASAADSLERADSLMRAARRARRLTAPPSLDSAPVTEIPAADSISSPLSPPDRTPPRVSAEPGPGLHDFPIAVRLFSEESCAIELRMNGDTAWRPYATPIAVDDSAHIVFRGTDSAGNRSETVERAYFIEAGRNRRCPQGMVYVTAGTQTFCIDRYEWPNRKGERPLSFVNWYMAGDSCRLHKKRLCSGGEWSAACAGRLNRVFPYGDAYEQSTCRTEDPSAAPSGSHPECRSFFGAYDMSGNLREWTGTKASRNASHYDVAGGFWDSKSASTCGHSQFSFYPENKFIAVGFRCCAEANP